MIVLIRVTLVIDNIIFLKRTKQLKEKLKVMKLIKNNLLKTRKVKIFLSLYQFKIIKQFKKDLNKNL